MSVEVTRLPSGLTVVTDSMPHLQTASLGVWVERAAATSSRTSTASRICWNTWRSRAPRTGRRRRSPRTIEAVGGDINAATSAETTAYFAQRAEDRCAAGARCAVRHPVPPDVRRQHELKREQNVIVQEIGATEDAPDDLVFDYLQATAFPDQPMGRSILGTPATRMLVQGREPARLSGAQLSRPRAWWFRQPARWIMPSWSRRPGGCSVSSTGRPRAAPQSAKFGGGSKLVARDLEQVHIAFALEGVPQRDPALYSLQVFTSVLGGGMSSRLFQEVREKRGLCYSISSFHMPYTDTGMFGIYAGTDAGDVHELMRVAIEETARTADSITEAEVDKAKAQMKVGLLMALESSGARARQLANQILIYGRPIPLAEIVAKVESVTVESARAAGRALIRRSRPAVAALGPGKGLEGAATIIDTLARRAA